MASAFQTAPVGLEGLEKMSTRVRSLIARSRSSGRGVQPSFWRNISSTGLPPASRTISG